MTASPYAILGVAPDATDTDIKRAYREASRRHHPDHGGDAEAFRAVKAAYDVLSDPEKRAALDRGEDPEESLEAYVRRVGPGVDAVARIARVVEEARDAAEDARAITELIEEVGVAGLAALEASEEDDEHAIHLKHGLLVILDALAGGSGAPRRRKTRAGGNGR